MHFIQYLYIYMKKSESVRTDTCACLNHVDLNVNSCSNIPTTFHD